MGNNSSSRSAVSTLSAERYAVERRERGQDCTSSEDSSELDREDSRDLDVYCGELRDGHYHGRGTLRYSRSDPRQRGVFEGDFLEGKRSGRGKLSWTNGTVYCGNWKDDRLHGTGVLELPSGLKYEGEFQHNKFHGQGTLTWKNGKQYVGSWKDNLRSGTGVLSYPADDSRHRMEYTGEWSKGMRHGQGVMRWTNGALYEGEWHYGKREGFGKHTFPSRQVRSPPPPLSRCLVIFLLTCERRCTLAPGRRASERGRARGTSPTATATLASGRRTRSTARASMYSHMAELFPSSSRRVRSATTQSKSATVCFLEFPIGLHPRLPC